MSTTHDLHTTTQPTRTMAASTASERKNGCGGADRPGPCPGRSSTSALSLLARAASSWKEEEPSRLRPLQSRFPPSESRRFPPSESRRFQIRFPQSSSHLVSFHSPRRTGTRSRSRTPGSSRGARWSNLSHQTSRGRFPLSVRTNRRRECPMSRGQIRPRRHPRRHPPRRCCRG